MCRPTASPSFVKGRGEEVKKRRKDQDLGLVFRLLGNDVTAGLQQALWSGAAWAWGPKMEGGTSRGRAHCWGSKVPGELKGRTATGRNMQVLEAIHIGERGITM
jgi:hypothetical protein